MRDGVAVAVLAVAFLGVGVWFATTTTDLPSEAAPNATFSVNDLDDGTVAVEHAGGEPLDGDAVRVLVYEDRLLPDRTVHASTWAENGTVGPGDRLRIEDPRIESGHRVVVRWFGENGQANLAETRL
ncbi:type IV pilin N-terminal domain-containing protein [Natronomonas marina]|uniref:type IV pilin N-terminal domain-containing protein n=1 Tax=Natronomonas marina TaxID=2961939 RepID=UPI0020C9DD5C|nr:type IV pilin N-terminal domain-containing protein [Natronomonas marina]